MRAQRLGMWLLALSVILVTACQPSQTLSEIKPIAMFEVTHVPVSAPAPTPVTQTLSGVRLTANISPMCVGAAQSSAECTQPYAGEFVVTALNGAVVTSVMTDRKGQATVELPPGKYILGVRTEEIYPLAAPVKVNVVPDRYVHISFSLDSGLPWQLQSK